MPSPDPGQSTHDPDCYCAKAGLGFSCAALAGELCQQPPVKYAMGNGGPCLSCGGNDGYGPAPHHTPDCYFASNEDASHAVTVGLDSRRTVTP